MKISLRDVIIALVLGALVICAGVKRGRELNAINQAEKVLNAKITPE